MRLDERMTKRNLDEDALNRLAEAVRPRLTEKRYACRWHCFMRATSSRKR